MKQGSMSRKRLVLVLVLTMILTSFSSLAVFADGHEHTLVLLHTNDMHGRVVEGQFDGMGFGKIATHVNEFRDMYDNVLLVDAGDTFHGLPIATLVQGESMVQLMNLVGYDVMAAGNHDFNYGQARLLELDNMADFPVLAANVYKADGSRLLEPYVIKEMEGFTVAFFGLATPETLWKSHPAHVGDLTFADPVTEAQAMVDELSEMADVIIAIGHLGIDEETAVAHRSSTVAEAVDGIHVFVDGHSHSILEEGMMYGDTLLVSAGYYGAYLGVVELTIMDDEVMASARLISKEDSEEVEEDQTVMALVDTLVEAQTAALEVVVGETTVRLEGEREFVRGGETNLGNLLTDVMMHVSGADLAFSNGGGIRASVEAGPINRGDIISVFPFGNQVEVKEVTGAMMKEILEHGTSAYPELSGGFPHVGGMSYQIDLSRPVGDRIVNLMKDGEMLDMEATYELATNDFLAAGGDGYTMLGELPTLRRMMALDEAIVEYLMEVGTVSPAVEGRITAVGELPEMEEEPEEMEPMPEMPEMPEMPAMEHGIHVVQPGEVLWRIAQQHMTTWEFLAELNQLANPHLIFPGQEIMYPAH